MTSSKKTRISFARRKGAVLLRLLCGHPLILPMMPLMWLILLPRERAYQGIQIRDFAGGRRSQSRALFYQMTCDALDLIRDHDVRRFHLVQRELRFIVNSYGSGAGATYNRLFYCCYIQFSSYLGRVSSVNAPHYNWYVAHLATTLIHEATHGRIYSHGIRYDTHPGGNWTRIEQICVKEAQRFACRLPQTDYPFATDLVTPFDKEFHEKHLNRPLHQRLADMQAYQKRKPPSD